jgi:hypothetical protein
VDGSEAALRDAVAADPRYAEAWYELATVEERLDESAASVESCEQALECRAEFPEALVALGDAWTSLRNAKNATGAYRRALQVSPGYATANYQLSLCLLGQGYFAEGWTLYESRFDPALLGAVTPPLMPMPMWQGEDLLGKKLLVLTEQGYGEHIQFARFVPLLARRGVDIVMGASPEMRELTATLDGVTRTVTRVEDAWTSGCDYWTYVGSLALRLGIGAGRVPAAVPYLRVDPARAQAWRARLSEYGNALKVGLCWAGRPTSRPRLARSIPWARLAPLAGARDALFFSVQTASGGRRGSAARRDAPRPARSELTDLRILRLCSPTWISDLGRFGAGASGRCAGSAGVDALPFQPDWRWRLDEDISRWYPTMRLFRQQRSGDWDEVIGRVAEALCASTTGLRLETEMLACRFSSPGL